MRECEEISICSDNAKNYNNNIIPIILPAMCDAIGLRLTTFIHPDACCGKSCVDAYFAISFRHLKRYICETKFDVLTPEDIFDALTYEGGITNTFIDYIRVNRQHRNLIEYELADAEKLNCALESPYEVAYEKNSDGSFMMKSYKYSNCHYRLFKINSYECAQVVGDSNHRKEDKETYSSEEERIEEEEKLEDERIARLEEAAKLAATNGETTEVYLSKVKRKKKRIAGPSKPPKPATIIARRERFQENLENVLKEGVDNAEGEIMNDDGSGDGENTVTRAVVEGEQNVERPEENYDECPYDAVMERYCYANE